MPDSSAHAHRFSRRQRLHTRFVAAWKTRHLLLALALILALGILSAARGTATASGSVLSAHSGSAARATHDLIGRADVHVDGTLGASEFELDLSISQTQNDCQAPLRGRVCLRYSISLDDQPLQSGYGVIPMGDVIVSANSITLKLDTHHESAVIRTSGTGGIIALTWSTPSRLPQPASRAAMLAIPTVRGSVIGYTIPSADVTAGLLLYGA